MVNKRTIHSVMLLGFCILFFVNDSFADKDTQVYTCVTTARRPVINQNIQEAGQFAEKDALDVALQNAFSTLVPNQIFASNLDFFYNRVLSKTKDYIITYKVLGAIENKNHYIVGIESKIDLNLLEKTLIEAKILNINKGRPVILFFISEQTVSDAEPKTWWNDSPELYSSLAEQVIADQMTQEGFMIIGNSSQRPDPSFYNIVFQSTSDTVAAIDLGRQMKADMIVFGSVVSQKAINRMGEEKTFNAVIHLDGYNIETGEKTITSQIEAVVKSETHEEGNINAIAKAAVLSARDLIDKIDAYWTQNLRKEHSFEVKIQGDKFHPRYLALTRRFKQMSGIENMQPKEMGSNYGILEMLYKGKATQFANALMLKTFDDFGFEFLEVSDNLVSIHLI
ncbi:MAG: hypothetical protein ABIJ31_11005 [Pseudomonadota bacterium]